ncbi:MAG: tetratricopeptide repeat protein [Desulfuromonadales bacterium]|nr:tetratricopeptide repeat protein [Desulfuromonadales bacterium]
MCGWSISARSEWCSSTLKGGAVFSFGNNGRGAGALRTPVDIAISSTGIIFVADPGSALVQAYNSDGVFLNAIGEGPTGVRLKKPLAVAIAPDDTLYILDAESATIFSYDPTGKFLSTFGGNELLSRGFNAPVDLAATRDEVFVLDQNADAILAFSRDGQFNRRFGSRGTGKGGLRSASGLTSLDDLTLSLSDFGNKRIQVLDQLYLPPAPLDLTVAPGMRVAELKWSASQKSYVDQYLIFRAEKESGPYLPIAKSNHSAFSDHKVEPDKIYYYRVAAVARKGRTGLPSEHVSVVPSKFKPGLLSDVKATANEWSIRLSWLPCQEDFVAGYRVYRKVGEELELLGTVTDPSFEDGGLASNSVYVYLVSAVSTDGEEGEKVPVAATTLIATKSPLSVDVIEMQNIFSNTYKKYESQGLGRLRVTNNTGVAIAGIKIAFTIKDFMDFPSETKIEALQPGESREFVLKAVFSNTILNVTEDTPVQTSIEASYYADEQLQKFIQSYPVNIYEKHRMLWDDRRQFATFITPKDPVLIEFVRSVAAQYGEDDFNMERSAAVFDALGLLGLTYIPDPSNPYQITSGRVDYVDYIQYPQETLQRRSGDCDDLAALYSSALESLGMRTRIVEVPGHMLMMFSTGMGAGADGHTMDNLFVIHEGELWVVVETTMVGSSFIKAWEKGSETYYKWLDNGLTLLDIREAWGEFKPASLASTAWRPAFVKREDIDARFDEEFLTLKRIGLRLKSQPYRERFLVDPGDTDAALQIGIIYGRANETADALQAFEKILAVEPQHVAALNNIGNLHLIEQRYDEACAAYEQAAAIEADDAMLWINLARCNLLRKNKDKARDAFTQAQKLDESVVQKHRILAMELMTVL